MLDISLLKLEIITKIEENIYEWFKTKKNKKIKYYLKKIDYVLLALKKYISWLLFYIRYQFNV